MEKLTHNANAMLKHRGPYENFAARLTVVLLASGAWITAILVALTLTWLRDRVIGDSG
jgi:hypothetical protein